MAQEIFDLRGWVRGQAHKGYAVQLDDDDHFVLETDFAAAQINFYEMEPDPEIVEFRIEDKATGEARFFLHFHPVDPDHAKQLFREMTQTLMSIGERRTAEVLLCCTAGMTTSFFADRLNQVAEAMGVDWRFSAVSVNEVYEHGQGKVAVLVAPQIAYQAERVQQVMGSLPVLPIPTATFAAYDAAGCIEWLRDELRVREQATTGEVAREHAGDIGHGGRVLVVAVHAARDEMNLHYRLYDDGSCELDRKVIKRRLALADVTDAIDTQICVCRSAGPVDAVGIALPGSLRDGRLRLNRTQEVDLTDGTDDFVIGDYLSRRYAVPVFLLNNANAAVLGWQAKHPEYANVTFYSQATGWAMGGQGHMAGGQLVEGAHGNAGEVKFVVDRFHFTRPLHYNAYDPADVLEMVGQVLAMDCATFDPEVVALRCDLLPDMEEVAAELARYVPREQQPKLMHVGNYNECILRGMLIRCMDQLG